MAATVLKFSNPRATANPRRRRRKASRRRRNARTARPMVQVIQRRNPGVARITNPRRRRRIGRRRNPAFLRSFGGELGRGFRTAIPVALGIYLSRYGTRYAIGARDAGAVGYGANALAAIALGAAARMIGQGSYAPLLTAGGLAGLALRVLTDYAPTIARGGQLADYVSGSPVGLRDYVSGSMRPGLRGLGMIPELDATGFTSSRLGGGQQVYGGEDCNCGWIWRDPNFTMEQKRRIYLMCYEECPGR